MKQKFESDVMEKLKKGYRPVYEGEEGFIAISMKAYLAAAEYAAAERSHFWYGDVEFLLIDVEAREDEIEAEGYDFMPAENESEDTESPEGRSDEICSDLEDAEGMYMLVNERLSELGGQLYDLRCDRLLKPEATEIDGKIQDIVLEMARYEKMVLRILAYIRAKTRR